MPLDIGYLSAINGFLPQPNNATTATGLSMPTVPWANTPPPAPPAPSPAPAPPPPPPGVAVSAPEQNMSVAPPSPPPSAGPPSPQAPPNDGGLSQLSPQTIAAASAVPISGGGYIPAREVSLLGPQQQRAIQASFDIQQGAVGPIEHRLQEQAKAEQQLYFNQAMEAHQREAATQAAAAAQQQELQTRIADIDETTKKLSETRMDPNRFWANQSTGQKIAGAIGLAMGGMLQGMRGGENPALSIINTAIDRDIMAQKFAYDAGMDALKGKRTAFDLAQSKYQNAFAAQSIATASALQAAQAQVSQMASQAKGVDAKNRAEELIAQLEAQRQQQIAKSLQFVQARSAPRMWRVPGIPVPLTDKEVKELGMKGYETTGALQMEDVKAGHQASLEAGKEQAKAAGDTSKLFVPTGPNGAGYMARSETEANQHRDKVSSANEVIDLVDRIKATRDKLGYGGRVAAALTPDALNSAEAKRATTLGKELMGAANRAEKFGALDKGATEVLTQMAGNPLAIGKSEEAKLEEIRRNAVMSVQRLEQSSTGSKTNLNPKGTVTGWQK